MANGRPAYSRIVLIVTVVAIGLLVALDYLASAGA